MAAKRIQRKRERGWKMPSGAIYVGRPSIFGNPFTDAEYGPWAAVLCAGGKGNDPVARADGLTRLYANWLAYFPNGVPGIISVLMPRPFPRPPSLDSIREKLHGKDLACFCPLVDKHGNPVPCHADVLLELSNKAT